MSDLENKVETLERRLDMLEELVLTSIRENSQTATSSFITEVIEVRKDGGVLNDEERKAFLARYELRITHWDHAYGRSWTSQGWNRFNGTGLFVDVTTGVIPRWTLIETAATNDCGIADNDNSNLQQFQNSDRGNFGWGRRSGETKHVCARLKFYGNGVVLTARVRSDNCG
jgi:hypothetical protein